MRTNNTGMVTAAIAVAHPRSHRFGYSNIVSGLPGIVVVFVIAAIATAFGRIVPVVGGPVFGICLGLLTTVVLRPRERLRPGASWASKAILQGSIVLLGTGLSLSQVLELGRTSLPVMIATLLVALAGAAVFGRLLKVDSETRLLIGVGTGICGASAIAAVTAVTHPAAAKVAYAIGTIFTFNVVAVLLYPPLGHALGLSEHAFGLWAGTAINDTSSVVAASYSYGSAAGDYAVVVKLTRSLMIIPICVVLSAVMARRQRSASVPARSARLPALLQLVPVFLVGFLAMSALRTANLVPESWHHLITTISVFLITMALAGIGLNTDVVALRSAGPRPLLLGAVLWFAVGSSSLLLQAATGTL